MNRVDLHVYRDKIKKLNKAVIAAEAAYYDFLNFQTEKMVKGNMDEKGFEVLEKFFENHPELSDMIDEMNKTLKRLSGN